MFHFGKGRTGVVFVAMREKGFANTKLQGMIDGMWGRNTKEAGVKVVRWY
jgi:hypothetical protein